MIEQILQKVINEMRPHLTSDQQDHLVNVLHINFHGYEIREECTDLTVTGHDSDELKIRMFLASKKAVIVKITRYYSILAKFGICCVFWVKGSMILQEWTCDIITE